jgi:hypothetical protein
MRPPEQQTVARKAEIVKNIHQTLVDSMTFAFLLPCPSSHAIHASDERNVRDRVD